MSKAYNGLGTQLKELLSKRSLSMREFSRLTNVDTATISRIISGKRKANLQHLEIFAECLNVPIAQLLQVAGYDVEQNKKDNNSDFQSLVEDMKLKLDLTYSLDKDFSLDRVKQQLNQYEQYSQTEDGQITILNNFEEKCKETGGLGPYINQLKEMYNRFRLKQGSKVELMLMGSALLYFIVPLDVIPDYTFPIGYLDDAMAVQLVHSLLSSKV
ncbi:DUF1232 domain-containing protein [Priestia flexa]